MNERMEFRNAEVREETERRIGKVAAAMRREGIDALLIGDNANIFYLSGRFFHGYIYLRSDGRTVYGVIRPQDFLPAEEIVEIRKPEQFPDALSERGIEPPSKLGLEFDSLPYSEIKRLSALFPEAEIRNASGLMRETRMVKTPLEIELIREDGGHQAAAYKRIGRLYKKDMTDLEFQIEIERILRLEGCLGYLRTSGRLMEINMGSVVSGDNADTPAPYDFALGGAGMSESLPVGANGMTMKNGTTVMVDMNGNFNGYQSDLSRVWKIGDIPEEAERAHECSRRILRELEQLARPGTEVCELYRRAEATAREEGFEKYFMGHRQQARFIGHGVGIELNEQPAVTARSRVVLAEGMVLALEPKFVIPGVGAVGVENTYAVTADGLENLTVFPEGIQDLI